MTDQPGGQHLGVVQDQQVAGRKQFGQVTEAMMGHGAIMPANNQQTGLVTRLGRLLSNQIGSKVIFERKSGHPEPRSSLLNIAKPSGFATRVDDSRHFTRSSANRLQRVGCSDSRHLPAIRDNSWPFAT